MGGTGDFGFSLASLLRSFAAFFSQSVRLSTGRFCLVRGCGWGITSNTSI